MAGKQKRPLPPKAASPRRQDRFARAFDRYIDDWTTAKKRRASHDQLRHLFTSFISEAFPTINASDIDLEDYVSGQAVELRGFIDLLYRNLIFEFKKDLRTERPSGVEELERYLKLQQDPESSLGVLTDGGEFEVYVLRDGTLAEIDKFKLEAGGSDAARLTLDCYLFQAHNVAPSAEDIVRRFGERSPVFHMTMRQLREAAEEVKGDAGFVTKYSEWNNLLAHVYGSAVGSEELFLRHTYLVVLTRLLAYIAIRRRVPADEDLPGIVDGRAFEPFGIRNLVEEDFFGWVVDGDARDEAVSVLRGLSAHLGVYDFTKLSEDVLKELYQHLVDPATRHDLGEFYTPDWLAERTLREAGFEAGKSMLDPSCGSGTFLFTAVRLLREQGMSGPSLVRFAFDNLAGIDVHPIAVIIAKVNLLLALLPDLKSRGVSNLPPLPVFMADTLAVPMRPNDVGVRVGIHTSDANVRRPRSIPGEFTIPVRLAARPGDLDAVIDRMVALANAADIDDDTATERVRDFVRELGYAQEWYMINGDFRLMRWLSQNEMDSVWAFVLRNAYRPAYFAERKFDIIAGNPPWLSYRYIARGQYQTEVRDLVTKTYALLSRGDVRLFTQMDLSTLFFSHCTEHFLAQGGTIAFVMPRSVITGAKQHLNFRKRGEDTYPFQLILDLQRVQPLFNVPTCVVIAAKNGKAKPAVPTMVISGSLPSKNASSATAAKHLTETSAVLSASAGESAASPYLPRIINGATIYPRSLFFVRASAQAIVLDRDAPQVETDPGIDPQAKAPWKGLSIRGQVEADFIYATFLAEDLLPFKLRSIRTVVLPLVEETRAQLGDKQRTQLKVLDSRSAAAKGYTGLAQWLRKSEGLWNKLKKETTQESLQEWVDYQGKLTRQRVKSGTRVVYNAAGSHVASSVLDVEEVLQEVRSLPCAGVAIDHKMYWFDADEPDEAHFLCAVLNSATVNEVIKPHQTRGAFGAMSGKGQRDIHRRPFEHVVIPIFEKRNRDHGRLVALSRRCHDKMADTRESMAGPVGRVRTKVRVALSEELTEIDELVRRVCLL